MRADRRGVNQQQLDACLAHLETAETLMEEAGDLAGLARLSLVIEMLRLGHGMSERPIDMDTFLLNPARRLETARKEP